MLPSKIKKRFILDLSIFVIFILGGLSPIKTVLINYLDIDNNILGNAYLANLFSNFRFHVIRDTIYNRVLIGPDNWLNYIGENSLDDFQHTIPFTEDELATIQGNLDSIQQQLAAKNRYFYVVIPPNKATIYPEKMPGEIQKLGEMSRLDQLVEYQKKHEGFDVIDLRQQLITAKQNEVVYYSSDSHWNPYGAWVGYYAITERISVDFPEITPHRIQEYEKKEELISEGDLLRIAGNRIASETILNLKPIYEEKITYQTFMENGVKYTISDNENKELPSAVVFKDSAFTALTPFLANHFSHAVYVWSFKYDSNLIDEMNPDIVIFECKERYIHTLLDIK